MKTPNNCHLATSQFVPDLHLNSVPLKLSPTSHSLLLPLFKEHPQLCMAGAHSAFVKAWNSGYCVEA